MTSPCTPLRRAMLPAVLLLLLPVVSAAAQSGGRGGSLPKDSLVRVFIRGTGGDAIVVARLDSLMRALSSMPLESPARASLLQEVRELVARMGGGNVVSAERVGIVGAELGPRMRVTMERAASAGEGIRRELTELLPKGYIGMDAHGPVMRSLRENGEYARYLAYPVIVGVEPNSPADRAGIARGDTLLAYNGNDIVRAEFNLTELFEPRRKLAVTVRRQGSDREYQVTVDPATALIMDRRLATLLEPAHVSGSMVALPRGGSVRQATVPSAAAHGSGGRASAGPARITAISQASALWGAELLVLKPELGRVFGTSRGVLVVDVPQGSPGHRMGLRASDVILALNGSAVSSVDELRVRLSRLGPVPAELEVLRDRKSRTIVVR